MSVIRKEAGLLVGSSGLGSGVGKVAFKLTVAVIFGVTSEFINVKFEGAAIFVDSEVEPVVCELALVDGVAV